MLRSLTTLAALAVAGALSAPAWPAAPAPKAGKFGPVLVAEQKSKSLCEADPHRVFVKYQLGSECIAYYVTPGLESKQQAVFFFDGDAAFTPDYADQDKQTQRMAMKQAMLDKWSAKMKIRYIYVSRVGLNGSSGNHADRRKPNETMVMSAAIDLLKERLGLTSIAIAGQSGGSTISASLVTQGRRDIACAVLGSGAFELTALQYETFAKAGSKITMAELAKRYYDPSAHIDGIRPDPTRRIFILGDPNDQRTPIDQQIRFHNQIEEAGHHVRFAFVDAKGELDHGTMQSTIPAAGACLNGVSDDRIVQAVRPKNGLKVSSATR